MLDGRAKRCARAAELWRSTRRKMGGKSETSILRRAWGLRRFIKAKASKQNKQQAGKASQVTQTTQRLPGEPGILVPVQARPGSIAVGVMIWAYDGYLHVTSQPRSFVSPAS